MRPRVSSTFTAPAIALLLASRASANSLMLCSRVAYGQVADQTPHHGGHPETPGIEATYMVGECDLPVAWHVDHSTQLPEITQIYVISVPSFGTSPDGAAPGDGDGA